MAPRLVLAGLVTILTVTACDAAAPSAPATAAAVTSTQASSTAQPSAAPSAAPSTGPSPASSAPPLGTLVGSIDRGRILMGVEGGGHAKFAYIDPSGLHDIDSAPDSTMAHGAWATPDTIVFDSERAGSRHLFRMAIADGAVTPLTTIAGQERAGVSSDGERIVSDNYDPSSNDRDLGLQVWSSNGAPIDAVTQPGDAAGVTGATQASFSPDGRSIAFVQMSDFDAERGAIFVVEVAGGVPRRLTPDADHVGYPRWSPDGRSILFSQSITTDHVQGPLLLVDVRSGNVRPLVDPGQGSFAFEGDWSPDGTQIAYTYWNSGLEQNQLWVASSDGTHQRALWVGYTGGIGTPDWGP